MYSEFAQVRYGNGEQRKINLKQKCFAPPPPSSLFFWSSCTCFPALRAAKQLNKVLFHSRTMFYFAAQLSELKTSRH
jgi:hypothetical protein